MNPSRGHYCIVCCRLLFCNDFSTLAKWAGPMFMKDFEKMRTCLDIKFPDLRETSRHWRKVCTMSVIATSIE